MKCPLCSTIVGVSYAGKRFLALHQGGKKCQQAQRKLNSTSTPKPRRFITSRPGFKPTPAFASASASGSKPEKPVSNGVAGTREYYASLELLKKPPKTKAKSVPTVGTSAGSSLEPGRASAGPTAMDSSTVTLVEDMLLTPPLVPTGIISLPPSLSLPLPLPVPSASVSKSIRSAVPPVVPTDISLGRNYDPKCPPSRQTHGQVHGPNTEHLHHPNHGPVLGRKPSPIVIEDSSDDEPSPACVTSTKYEPARGPAGRGNNSGSAKLDTHGFVDVKGANAPPGVRGGHVPSTVESKHFVLQAGLVDGEMKCWDETPEGQKFLALLRESVGKIA
ncbi:hypothetical protein FRC08_006449 [Ceratobasidium sp. 394]|nr:hypothetical protein FRC08_006449 [Ceratobasidium sp. 394]